MMTTESHFRRGKAVEVVTDASPWGIGAVLVIDGTPTEYFSAETTAEDAAQLGLELTRGSNANRHLKPLEC